MYMYVYIYIYIYIHTYMYTPCGISVVTPFVLAPSGRLDAVDLSTDWFLEGTKGVPRNGGRKKQPVWSCLALDSLRAQTLVLTDVQTPFFGTPLVLLRLQSTVCPNLQRNSSGSQGELENAENHLNVLKFHTQST